jgi:hypothetical protein
MTDNKSTKQKKLRIQRVNPENISPIHVNDMTASHTENEFFLTFSELEPPAVLEESELEKIDTLEAVAKTKIVVTPNFVRAILRTLTENLATYESKMNGENDE